MSEASGVRIWQRGSKGSADPLQDRTMTLLTANIWPTPPIERSPRAAFAAPDNYSFRIVPVGFTELAPRSRNPVTTYWQSIEKLTYIPATGGIQMLHRTITGSRRIEQRQLARTDRLDACLTINFVMA